MHEILRALPRTARVLDLGSATGSFERRPFAFRVVRVDAAMFRGAGPGFVQADAACLPFPDGCFDATVCNHGLEHFSKLDAALSELGRVTNPQGALFVAVPDAGTFTDILYRWLARGGGHVNPFRSAARLEKRIEQATGLKHAGTRLLHTSLSFLNKRNRKAPPPRKLLLLGGGQEWTLVVANYVLRLLDRAFGTRASVYGWAMYFGNIGEPVRTDASINVCARCGSGHPDHSLIESGRVSPSLMFFRSYTCPGCGARNFFVRDR